MKTARAGDRLDAARAAAGVAALAPAFPAALGGLQGREEAALARGLLAWGSVTSSAWLCRPFQQVAAHGHAALGLVPTTPEGR